MHQRTIADQRAEHEFFAGLDPATVTVIAGCGQNVHFDAGAYVFRESERADRLYVLREG